MLRNTLSFFAASLLYASVVSAQTAPPFATELKQVYAGVKANLTKMAEKMPEEHYAFKPVPEIRTFGELVAHVADSQARGCSALAGAPKSVDAASKKSKADLVAALNESFAICDGVVDGLTDAGAGQMVETRRGQRTKLSALYGTIAHSNLEYGYMAVYLRLKGIVPPSSEGR